MFGWDGGRSTYILSVFQPVLCSLRFTYKKQESTVIRKNDVSRDSTVFLWVSPEFMKVFFETILSVSH